MFDRIAPSYDRLNHLLSLDVDRLWRRRAIREITDGSALRVLDVACRTGDSTVAIARALPEGGRVVGSDISEQMMRFVMDKARAAGVAERVSVELADAENLPYADASFDRVTCAFGVRNFEHKERGLAEMYRVLKPGGRLVILELSVPENKLVRWCYGLYFKRILPKIGGALSGDRPAYAYLPASVYSFPSPLVFSRMMADAGFVRLRRRSLTAGLCRMFIGEK